MKKKTLSSPNKNEVARGSVLRGYLASITTAAFFSLVFSLGDSSTKVDS